MDWRSGGDCWGDGKMVKDTLVTLSGEVADAAAGTAAADIVDIGDGGDDSSGGSDVGEEEGKREKILKSSQNSVDDSGCKTLEVGEGGGRRCSMGEHIESKVGRENSRDLKSVGKKWWRMQLMMRLTKMLMSMLKLRLRLRLRSRLKLKKRQECTLEGEELRAEMREFGGGKEGRRTGGDPWGKKGFEEGERMNLDFEVSFGCEVVVWWWWSLSS